MQMVFTLKFFKKLWPIVVELNITASLLQIL